MDGILCFPPFIRFSETLVLLYVLTYGGTGYGFFCQPLLLNEQILSISKIGHTDKEIPVMLLNYSHFTKYEFFIHTKLIVVFCCSHICCCALIYSHLTSPKKAKKKCIPARHQTSKIFCWVYYFCRFPNLKTVLWHVTKLKFANLFTVTKQRHLHSCTSPK
jgi:hypothetical protein